MNKNLQHRLYDENYRKFMLQLAADVMAARKNGILKKQIDNELDMLIQDVSKDIGDINSVDEED